MQQAKSEKKIHNLKPRRKISQRRRQENSHSTKKTQVQVNELLWSISPKLKARSISISTDSRLSTVFFQKQQANISCIDGFSIKNFIYQPQYTSLNFQELKRLAIRKGFKKITKAGCHHLNHKKVCFHSTCIIKQKWIKKMVIDEHQIKKVKELRKISQNSINKYWEQIQKDLYRSLPQHMVPKTKLTLFHVNSEKTHIYDSLRSVLRMYTISDEQLGYVQGMNMVAGIIVSHVKEVQASYIIFRQIMGYGGLRNMYLFNFQVIREETNILLHHHIKNLMRDLYQFFEMGGVESQIFTGFYLTLFSNVVDYEEMHNVIDLYVSGGVVFLHKLMISLLCFLKQKLLCQQPDEVLCLLGPMNLKEAVVPWDQVINLTQGIELS